MKKFALIALALATASTAALAAGTSVTNNSGLPIDELYASAPGKNEFGKNLMEGVAEGALDSGKTAEISALADGKYDLRVSAPDEGVLCVIQNVKVKGGKIDLTEKEGKACK